MCITDGDITIVYFGGFPLLNYLSKYTFGNYSDKKTQICTPKIDVRGLALQITMR